jgi:muramidase (phage lysozyme)
MQKLILTLLLSTVGACSSRAQRRDEDRQALTQDIPVGTRMRTTADVQLWEHVLHDSEKPLLTLKSGEIVLSAAAKSIQGWYGVTWTDDGYDVTFGYKTFASCKAHPELLVTEGGVTSDAAGRYQFLSTTWQGLGLPSFTPDQQDKGAIMLVRSTGANLPSNRPLTEAEFNAVLRKIACTWASLPPYCYRSQGGEFTEVDLWEKYLQYAGP